jgi:putative ATP-dependent endonuclease of the OLD family
LNTLIICSGGHTFPMGNDYTELEQTDYAFLERFLDTTKANLFFAKGVILVEGWAEEQILPALARKMKNLQIINNNLTEAGVSIVNVGNTAFLRYARIFKRKVKPEMDIPVSIITDLDDKPEEFIESPEFKMKLSSVIEKGREKKKGKFDESRAIKAAYTKYRIAPEFDSQQEIKRKEQKYDGQTLKTFVSPHWTLEYCLGLSEKLCSLLFQAVKNASEEMRSDGQSRKIVHETWEEFSKSKAQEQIAYTLYSKFIGSDNAISKSIIAQHFAELLDSETSLTANDLINDKAIGYLIGAIRHASKQD